VPDLTVDECNAFWTDASHSGYPFIDVAFKEGQACVGMNCDVDNVGACCVTDTGVCCDSFTREICDLVQGIFLGTNSTCDACLPGSRPEGVCAVPNAAGVPICTADVDEPTCEVTLGGTWYADIGTCTQGIPNQGMGISPSNQPAMPWDPNGQGNVAGACCYEYQCIANVPRYDCILAGGIPIAKVDNPFHPNCDRVVGPLYGACCYDNDRYGRVCIDDTQASCLTRRNSTWCATARCGDVDPDKCEVCDPLDLCAPGRCQFRVTYSSTNPPTSPPTVYVIDMVAADEDRCSSRDGVWGGQIPRGRSGGSTPRRAEDLSRDGRIDVRDLMMLISQWGDAGSADLDGNGQVDVADLQMLLAAW